MDDERSDADLPAGLRRSKNAAWGAFLVAVTSLLLPWWLVRFEQGGLVYEENQIGVFSPSETYSHAWLPYLAAALMIIAAGWLFVRIAGRSFLYEPQIWRRDLLIIAGIISVALLSTQFWPAGDVGAFFETARFDVNGTGAFERVAMAGLGFWLALAAVLAAVLGWWLAGQD